MNFKTAQTILWSNIFRNRSHTSEIDKIEFLKSIRFFQNLTLWQVGAICDIIHERTYEKGEYLFEIDQPGAALFIVKEGRVAIEIPKVRGDATEIACLNEGSFLGELALLDQSPRSASARAVVKTKCLAFFRNDLNGLVKSQPEIACQIVKSLALIIGERLRDTTTLLKVEAVTELEKEEVAA